MAGVINKMQAQEDQLEGDRDDSHLRLVDNHPNKVMSGELDLPSVQTESSPIIRTNSSQKSSCLPYCATRVEYRGVKR